MKRTTLLALTLLTAIGCRSQANRQPAGAAQQQPQTAVPASPPMKPAPPTPLEEKKAEVGSSSTWKPEWDAFIEKTLPPEMLSAQAARAVHPLCPAFAQMSEADQRSFWAYTLQALAAAEAGLKPTADVHHTQAVLNRTDRVSHRPIHQEGLLQLTYEDAKRYGCAFDYEADARLPEKSPARTILDPQRNLACGLRIMNEQISTKGEPLLTRHSYWSTLQPGTRSYRVFAKQMANVPAACGLRVRPGRSSSR